MGSNNLTIQTNDPVSTAAALATHTTTNSFSWAQQLAVPAAQAAAQILLLNRQKDHWDDIKDEDVGYLESAINQWEDCMDLILDDLEAATDDVPEPAIYQPVSAAGEQWNSIQNNIKMLCDSKEYSGKVGQLNLKMDLARSVVLNPKYYQMNEVTWCSISDLMNGVLPIGLTVQSLTESAGQNFSTGRLGRHAGNYRRNLGIVDYKVQKDARREQREERASQASHVSSLTRQGDIRDMMQTPQQRIGYALQQAQLIQNSLQNANNAAARKSPHLMQKIQVGIQKCQHAMQLQASKAALADYVPDFASVINNQVRDVINGLGEYANRG